MIAFRRSRKFGLLIRFLAFGTGIISVLSILFFFMFRIFENITYDSISDLNKEFVSQIDSSTETLNSTIVNYGMQLFYSDSVKTLMGSSSFSNTERVYMIRNLNTSLSSTDFAEEILVYNGHNDHVYSTDASYPDQLFDQMHHAPIHELLQNRNNNLRFKPIFCKESDSFKGEYYVFMFYEVYPDQTPKPGALIINIKSDWYRKLLLATAPTSDMIVIDDTGSVLVSGNESLQTEYQKYYPSITSENNSGYYVDHDQDKFCLYYRSPRTGHTYMRFSSLKNSLPRLFYFRHIVICFLAAIISIFAVIVIILLIFSLIPMLRMKDAMTTIEHLQAGYPNSELSDAKVSVPLEKQIATVISHSERSQLEQIFYDMLAGKAILNGQHLFPELAAAYQENGNTDDPKPQFGLLLVSAQHRKDIYNSLDGQHPEFLVTKSSHVYACIGLYHSVKDYSDLYQKIGSTCSCRLFISELFEDFTTLLSHFSKLDELRKLSLVLPENALFISEAMLEEKSASSSITSKDFTDLIVCLKSGSIESVRAKWNELLSQMQNCRYEDFQYLLNRTEDTIRKVQKECQPDNDHRLLPESLEQIRSLDEITQAFNKAFVLICSSYTQKKAEKYSDLAAKIKNIIQNEYHDNSLNSQLIADRIQMNNAYVGRLFKNSYGHSINDYINTCRIKEAMSLLKESDCPISEIARQVGFSNIKYFFVLFKKFTGKTPAVYREDLHDLQT